MKPEEKVQFDAIADLYKRAWEQFNERRRHEFRVALAYWAALAGASAGSVQLATLPDIPGGRFSLVAFSITTVLLYVFWLYGVWRAHGTDQGIAIYYQKKMQALAGAEFDTDMQKFIDNRTKQMGKLVHPSAMFHIGLTFLLAFSLVLVNWGRFQDEVKEPEKQTVKSGVGLESAPDEITDKAFNH